jgi:hypothetical protein
MSLRIYQHRALTFLLCGLVFLALWNSAIVWTFCPHVNTTSRHCLTEQFQMTAMSTTMSHEHHDDMAMSMTDEKEVVEGRTIADSKTANKSIGIDPVTTSDEHVSEAFTESQETCSHCMMHSQSGVNSPSMRMVLSNSASESIAVVPSTIAWALLTAAVPFVDVHDHGPPGRNSSRYILNSSFRI